MTATMVGGLRASLVRGLTDYLTRQVAALDATAKGHVGLASYYTERGESPGAWVGALAWRASMAWTPAMR
jgi:hypothetical protein